MILNNNKTLVMGIVNMTPDSFSGQNTAPTPTKAVTLALTMLDEGADIIDIGAESSRPGAKTLTATEEIARLGNVVAHIRNATSAPISIDTYHPETAAHTLQQGANIINDITALRNGWGKNSFAQTEMASVVAEHKATVALMHMPDSPDRMQTHAGSPDEVLVRKVRDFLAERAAFAESQGIAREHIWIDPGFGFGKDLHGNLALLRALPEFAAMGYPVLVGLSRKRMIDDILHLPPAERLEGSLALAVIAASRGARIVRTHDVRATVRALAVADAVLDR